MYAGYESKRRMPINVDQVQLAMTQFGRRLSYATAAVATAWLVSGVIFVSLIRGPGTVAAWLIWGTGIFATA